MPSPSRNSTSGTPAPQELTITPDLAGGHADVDHGWIAWQSNAVRGGRSRNSIWVSRLNWKAPRLVREMPKGDLGAGVSLSYPYLTWVQYRETGNTTGTWRIFLHDIRKNATRVAADWRTTEAGSNQPIPLPYLDPVRPTLVWHQLEATQARKQLCVVIVDIRTDAKQRQGCTADKTEFPRFARMRDSHLAYIVNTGKGGQQGPVSIPVSPDHPELQELFSPEGALSGWNRYTRAVEADENGVAWIAESTEYAKGAAIYYWEPGRDLIEMPVQSRRFPASQLHLTDDALVWEEPIEVNDILAVRRSVFGCEGAVERLGEYMSDDQTYRRNHAKTFQLQGGSEDQVLIGIFRSINTPPYALPFTFAVFDLDWLPSTCDE